MISPSPSNGPLRVGIGGPVGSGKTALVDRLCKHMRDRHRVAVITNDIYTREDAQFLTRSGALPPDRIEGVETGGCPHTAIREDASINLQAVDRMVKRFPDLELLFIESGGDNLAATFSPELADLTIYVIDVSAQQDRPRAAGRRRSRRDGPRRQEDARRAPVPLHQPQDPARRPRDRPVHHRQGRFGFPLRPIPTRARHARESGHDEG